MEGGKSISKDSSWKATRNEQQGLPSLKMKIFFWKDMSPKLKNLEGPYLRYFRLSGEQMGIHYTVFFTFKFV